MKVETDSLMTVKHFADMKGVTTTAVYNWIAMGKEKSIKIDGVSFVVVK